LKKKNKPRSYGRNQKETKTDHKPGSPRRTRQKDLMSGLRTRKGKITKIGGRG